MQLMNKNLWGIVNGKETTPTDASKLLEWQSRDDRAKAIIGLALSDSELHHVDLDKSSKEIWDTLIKLFGAKAVNAKFSLKLQLYRFKIDDGVSMSSHINNLRSLIKQLVEVKAAIEDEDAKAILLNSLSSKYSNVVFTLSQIQSQSLDNMIAALLAEEKRTTEDAEVASVSMSAAASASVSVCLCLHLHLRVCVCVYICICASVTSKMFYLILSLDPVSGRAEMTLKTQLLTEAVEKGDLDIQEFYVGDMISGIIKRVEPFGIFVTIEDSNIIGFCDSTELSDKHIDDIQMKYSVGERVEAKILQVDEGNKNIQLGMKDSYLENKSVAGALPYRKPAKVDRDGPENIEFSEIEDDDRDCELEDSSEESGKSETQDVVTLNTLPISREFEARASVPPLEVTFDTETNMSDIVVDDNKENLAEKPSEMGEKDGTKLTKRAKKRLKEQRELEIRAAEQKRLAGDQVPDSMDEYEQLVRASPNSSFVWIKYMAFMLSLADVEKARAIAERALQTINFREEGEKLNIWVAYFNLENVYGSPPNEAVLKVFQRALQYCDPKKVHLALLGMYDRTEQHEMTDQLLKSMTRKFKTSSKVWLRYIQNLLKRGSDSTHTALDTALVSLPRHKHIKFISQTAILEFKIGSAERARSLFEGVLRNYPKRTDLWSVYLDQEIRIGDTAVVRALFERIICLDLPPKKMK
ncbi:hypothetical protein KI387_007532, partial [Taxus chinensis]